MYARIYILQHHGLLQGSEPEAVVKGRYIEKEYDDAGDKQKNIGW
jgi:hypothetical protein